MSDTKKVKDNKATTKTLDERLDQLEAEVVHSEVDTDKIVEGLALSDKAKKKLQKQVDKLTKDLASTPAPAFIKNKDTKEAWKPEKAWGVTINGHRLEPVYEKGQWIEKQDDEKSERRLLMNRFDLEDRNSISVYRYVYNGTVFVFNLTGDASFEGTHQNLEYIDPPLPSGEYRNRFLGSDEIYIGIEGAHLKNVTVGGYRNEVIGVNLENCTLKNSNVTYKGTQGLVGFGGGRMKDVRLINSTVINSIIDGSGLIENCNLRKVKLDAKNFLFKESMLESGDLTGQWVHLERVTLRQFRFYANGGRRVEVSNLRHTRGVETQDTDVYIHNPFDFTAIELLDKTLTVVRTSKDNVALRVGRAVQENIPISSSGHKRSPWDRSTDDGVDLYAVVKKLYHEDRDPFSSTDPDLDTEFNRRFLDFTMASLTSRLNLISMLQDALNLVKETGAKDVLRNTDPYF